MYLLLEQVADLGEKSDVCGRCGWKPEQGAEPLAYCPECGYVIKKDTTKPVKIPDCQWG